MSGGLYGQPSGHILSGHISVTSLVLGGSRYTITLPKVFTFRFIILASLVLGFSADARGVTNKDFEWALGRAKSAAGSLNNSLIQPKDGSIIPMVKGIQEVGSGEWKVLINGAWLTSSSKFRTVTYTAVVKNTSSGFEYAFLGQPVAKHLVQMIRDHKGMVKAEKAWRKRLKGVQMDLGAEGDRVALAAKYDYASGADRGDVASHLKELFNASNGVLLWTEYGGRDVEKDYAKNLSKNKITYLRKNDFLNLTGDGLSEVESENEDVAEGYWLFTNKGRDFELFNYGNKVILSYYREIPASVSGEKREEFFAKMQEFVDKNKLKRATSQEVVWFDEEIIWIKVHYEFDGTLKGKDFKDSYWKFKDKFAMKLHKEIDKTLKKL